MAFNLVFVGTVSAANSAVAAMQAQPGNAAEAAAVARLIPYIQTEINAMGAANSVSVYIAGMHNEKTLYMDVNIDKATPLPLKPGDLVQLSNASPAN